MVFLIAYICHCYYYSYDYMAEINVFSNSIAGVRSSETIRPGQSFFTPGTYRHHGRPDQARPSLERCN